MMRWMKGHLSAIGLLIFAAGFLMSGYALAMPVAVTTTVGNVSTTRYYFSAYLFLASCALMVFGGALMVIRNEARGYFDRKSLLDFTGIKKK